MKNIIMIICILLLSLSSLCAETVVEIKTSSGPIKIRLYGQEMMCGLWVCSCLDYDLYNLYDFFSQNHSTYFRKFVYLSNKHIVTM